MEGSALARAERDRAQNYRKAAGQDVKRHQGLQGWFDAPGFYRFLGRLSEPQGRAFGRLMSKNKRQDSARCPYAEA